MRRVSYDKFLPEVLPYVHDCPELVAINAIRNACIEFCELAHYLRETTELEDIEAGEAEYVIGCTPGFAIVVALSVAVEDQTLHAASADQLTARFGANWRERSGTPLFFTQETPNTIILSPTPDKTIAEAWSATLAVKPSRDSREVAESLLEHWVEVISFGARARIQETPNQPFSDAASASVYRTWFKAGCNRARAQVQRGLGRASLRVRPCTFGV